MKVKDRIEQSRSLMEERDRIDRELLPLYEKMAGLVGVIKTVVQKRNGILIDSRNYVNYYAPAAYWWAYGRGQLEILGLREKGIAITYSREDWSYIVPFSLLSLSTWDLTSQVRKEISELQNDSVYRELTRVRRAIVEKDFAIKLDTIELGILKNQSQELAGLYHRNKSSRRIENKPAKKEESS